MFADADCLAMNNVDGLFCRPEAIRFLPEPGITIAGGQFTAFLTDQEIESNREGSTRVSSSSMVPIFRA
ncbi:MAG: hypothetical protein R3F11_14790 [Verrucomicrobiales bacterium]